MERKGWLFVSIIVIQFVLLCVLAERKAYWEERADGFHRDSMVYKARMEVYQDNVHYLKVERAVLLAKCGIWPKIDKAD